MRGQPDARQPPSSPHADAAGAKAARILALAQLRAEAASTKAAALALLVADYGGRIAIARQQLRGDQLAAAITAILAEQRAAERALAARLDSAAKARRKAAAAEATARRGSVAPHRPRDQVRARAPGLRR